MLGKKRVQNKIEKNGIRSQNKVFTSSDEAREGGPENARVGILEGEAIAGDGAER